jgi:hypothetical protein
MVRILVLSAVLLLTGVSALLAQDPGMQDSVILNVINDHVDSSGQFQFRSCQILAVTDDSVGFYNMPLRLTAPLGGVSFGTPTQYFPPLTLWNERYDTVMTSDNYIRIIGWCDLGIDSIPPPALYTDSVRVNIMTLRIIISPNAPSQLVTIDTTWDDRNGSVLFGLVSGLIEFTPAFQKGYMSIGAVGVDGDKPIPTAFTLRQNYPNPFNPATTIEFAVAEQGHVTLEVFDLLGRLVDVLANGDYEPGNYSLVWNGDEKPSGIYFYKLTAGNYSDMKQMLLLK